MKTFSIAELEQYSLIKAHTFRTWEYRFKTFKTKRTNTNVRYYTLEDLAFLLDLSVLNRYGSRVSTLASLDREKMMQKVLDLNNVNAQQERQINQLVIHMFSLNIEDFELALDSAVLSWGINETIDKLILPFLERLKLFSYKNRTSGEYHFVVTALRKKLILGIEQAAPKQLVNKSALLYLPEGQHFDLVLLYLNYKLRQDGFNVLYLGTNISDADLKEVIGKKRPDFIVTYMAKRQKNIAEELIQYLNNEGLLKTYFITGSGQTPEGSSSHQNLKYVCYRQAVNRMLDYA